MTNYGKMAKEAAGRRKALQKELAAAKRTVSACEKEIAVLDQILGALKGAAPARVGGTGRGRGRKAGGRKAGGKKASKNRGKWRPGKPGRPPKWWVEQQKAGGKATGKRKTGRKKAAGKRKSSKGKAARRRTTARRAPRKAAAPAPAAPAAPEAPAS